MKIKVKDLTVNYSIHGHVGPWVTLAHPHSSNHSAWAALATDLAANHRVLCFDARGHGETTATAPPYTMAQLADDAFALLNALEIEQTHWVGQAMGAMVGQALAIQNPQAVLSLVLADSTLGNPAGMQPVWAERNAAVRSQGLGSVLESTLQRWFMPQTLQHQPELIAQITQMILQTSVDGYVGGSSAMASMDLSATIDQIGCPTLVMVGDHDPATPLAMSQAIHEKIAGSTLIVLPDCSHMSYLEQTELFNRQVVTFLSRLQ